MAPPASLRRLAAPLTIHVVVAAVAFAGSVYPAGDFDRYWAIASAAGRPYRDFPVEFSIGTLLVFRALGAAGSRAAFGILLVLLNVAADAAIIGGLAWGWGVGSALAFCWAVLPILHLLLSRVDLWSIAAATIAVAAWERGRLKIAGGGIAAGVAFKLWPALFAPLLLVPARGRRAAPALGALAAGLALVAGTWWAFAGWSGLYQVLTFRGARGWQVESSVGSFLALFRSLPLRQEAGATRIGSTSGAVAIALFLAAGPIALWSIWRGARSSRVGEGWLAGVGALLLLSALFSAQYIGWLLPGAAIVWQGTRRMPAALAFAAVAMTGLIWGIYDLVLAGSEAAFALIVARNIVVLLMAVSAGYGLRTSRWSSQRA